MKQVLSNFLFDLGEAFYDFGFKLPDSNPLWLAICNLAIFIQKISIELMD